MKTLLVNAFAVVRLKSKNFTFFEWSSLKASPYCYLTYRPQNVLFLKNLLIYEWKVNSKQTYLWV